MSFGSAVLGKTIIELGVDRSGYDKGIAGVERDASRQGKGIGGTLGKSLGGALPVAAGLGIAGLGTAITVGVGGAMAGAISLTKDFEHGLSAVGAVSGATKAEMGKLSDTALRIGKDTQFGASEAVSAMETLAANGVSTTDIINGAADAAVNLAAAGGTDLATAADTASTAMAVWGLKTSDMADVVNRLAGAANVSRFGVEDMSLAIAQGGGAAQTAGVEFGDFATAIAAIAPNFSSGSDAGTSMKTFLTRLVPTTKDATATMKELGLMGFNTTKAMEQLRLSGIEPAGTSGKVLKDQLFSLAVSLGHVDAESKKAGEQFDEYLQTQGLVSNAFFDANGNLKSMAEITDALHNATKDLTEEQKTQALTTMFGTDAMRAAAGIAGLTGEEFTKMSDKMRDTSAADVAAKRTDNLAGSWENFKGALETVGIEFGMKITPMLKDLADFGSVAVPAVFDWVATHTSDIAAAGVAFGAFVGTTLAFQAISGVGAVFAAIKAGILGVNLSLLSPPGIALLIAGIATALFLLWKHWDDIWPKLEAGWDWMKTKAGELKESVVGFFTDLKDGIGKKIDEVKTKLSDTWDSIKTDSLTKVTDLKTGLDRKWDDVKTKATDTWADIKTDLGTKSRDIKTSLTTTFGDTKSDLDRTWDKISTKARDTWDGIKRKIDDLNPGIASAIKWPFEHARDAIGGIMEGFKQKLAGPWNSAARGINEFIVGTVLAVNWVGRALTGKDVIGWGGLPTIPQFRRGGITPGGPVITGEDGAELIMPPAGSRVFNARETVDIFKAVNNGQHPEGVPLGVNGPLGLGAGPFAGAINAVKSLAGSAADAVRGVLDRGVGWLIDSALGGLGLNTGGGAIGSLGGGILTHVMGMAKDAITEIFNAVKQALPDSVPNGNAILDMAYRTPGAYMWCEKFVGDVMQAMGLRYHRAASAAQHAGMQKLNPGTGPAGAVVFLPWDTYGHVAFSLGDGRIYGTANTPSGKGVMPAWAGAGWTATPFAKGGIVTGPVNAVVGEAGHEAIIPLDQLPEVIEGGLTPAFTALFKPTGKAGQALGEVNDAVVETKAAVDKSARDNVDWLAGIYNLEGINQNVTKDGFEKIDTAISSGNKSSKTTLGQILDILRDSSTGSRPLYVTQTGGGSVSDQLSGALDPANDVISGGLTPGMGNFISGKIRTEDGTYVDPSFYGKVQAEDGSWVDPSFYGEKIQAEDGSWVDPSFYGKIQAEDGSWVNPSFYASGDLVVSGSGGNFGAIGADQAASRNEDVITGSWTGFATGGLVRGRHPLLGMIGEGIHDEIISPVPILRDLLKEALLWAGERGRTISDGLTITVNLNGEMHVNSRQDLDRLGSDVAGAVVAGMRRLGVA